MGGKRGLEGEGVGLLGGAEEDGRRAGAEGGAEGVGIGREAGSEHVAEKDEGDGGIAAAAGVGGDERGPGEGVAAGHSVEQAVGVVGALGGWEWA